MPKRYIARYGKRAREYTRWRDEEAIPYLDAKYGHTCVVCGSGGQLDVDHILGRGSHPHLKMVLSNVQFMCRSCHRMKTDRL